MSLPTATGRDRIWLYSSTILFQWALTALVGWRAFARGLTRAELGLSVDFTAGLLVLTIAGGLLIACLHWMNLRRMSRSEHEAVNALRAIGARLFPRTATELVFYILLSLTAGLCEEFLFRGFVIAVLFRLGLASWLVVILSSFMFGIAHLYQGRGGSMGTGIVGTVFATARIAYNSLLPVAIWHAVLDIVAGIAGSRYLAAPKADSGNLNAVQA